jgi:cell division inhibitor SepF
MATSGLRKAWLWLGLGDDEDYDYDDVDVREPREPRPAGRGAAGSGAGRVAATPQGRPNRGGQVPAPAPTAVASRSDTHDPAADDVRVVGGKLRPIPAQPPKHLSQQPHSPAAAPTQRRGPQPAVRPVPAPVMAKPHVISPTTFNEAQEVGDKYKSNVPVIVNLQAADRDLSRRLIDFASGLCYGLGGSMERVANQVFLLTPSSVEISPEERRRLHEGGYSD